MEGSDPFALTVQALKDSGKGKNGTLKVRMLVETMPYVLTYYAHTYDSTAINDCYVNGAYTTESPYTVNYIYYDYLTSGGNISISDQNILMLEKQYYNMYVRNSIYTEVDKRTLEGYSVDGELRTGLNTIVASLGLKEKTMSEKIEIIKNYIQNAAYYTLDFDVVPEGEDTVLYFLNVSKNGKCWHYATAATMLYRAAGIPARFVTGYMVNITQPNTYVDVSGKNAHGWVEVYVRGIGWIQVEVTGSSRQPQQEYHKIVFNTASAEMYYGEQDILTAEVIYWNEFASQNSGWSSYKENGKTKWVCSNEGQEGHWFYQEDVTFRDGLRDVGIKSNAPVLTIYDKAGNSVNSEYKMSATGTLTVKPIEVVIKSGSGSYAYDGKGAYCTEWEITSVNAGSQVIDVEELKKRIQITFDFNEQTPFMHKGEERNTFEAYVLEDGKIAGYYDIKPVYGTITVK